MRTEKITLYRLNGKWRWHWKAVNGRIIGASTESYWNRGDCVRNLERLCLGDLEIQWHDGDYAQGKFCQLVDVDRAGMPVLKDTTVEILG